MGICKTDGCHTRVMKRTYHNTFELCAACSVLSVARSMTLLESWLEGSPMHDTILDVCVPDGSCCGKEMWPRKKRLETAERTMRYILEGM